tara:strand:+ start:704 stop:877 length:174 start_codon:yes stop_codon:yes gene_type:complete
MSIFETIFFGLIIMLPTLYAVILKTKLDVAEYERDYYRNKTLGLNAAIRRHLNYEEE